jgi:hypothetical protein
MEHKVRPFSDRRAVVLPQARRIEVWKHRRGGRRTPVAPRLGDKLVLTYDNTALTDGVGAQLQRIYGIWAISRLLGVPYLHSPIACVDYQGLTALEANASDPTFHLEFNELFDIESDPLPTDEFHTINLRTIHPGQFRLLEFLVDSGATRGKPGLVRLVMPYGIADRFPDCYEPCKEISPFAPTERKGRVLRVAVHVRRGEQTVLKSDRLLPNAYYIEVATNVARVLDALKLCYRIELWTEVPTEEFTVYGDHHGIFDRAAGPVLVTPEMYRLDDFDVVPNLVRCINGKTIDCLRSLATADILIMSKSSFSYVAAVLNRNGIVLYHPFWHPAPSSWTTVQPDGQFDRSALIQALTAPTD